MTLTITAALVGPAVQPLPIRVNIVGLTIGQDYQVTASSGTWSRIVQGGEGIATSTQLVLTDVATPLNAPIDYTIVHAGATVATTASVVVAYAAADSLLQSLDGDVVAGFWWEPNGDPRTPDVRAAFYRPAGRARAIMHYDVGGADSGTIVADTTGADTTALLALISAGAPVLIRLTPGATVTDIDPVDVLGISAASRALRDVSDGPREWTLAYTLVDDLGGEPLVMVTLADLDAYYAGQTLADWNTQWAGKTLADVNAFDWHSAL